jgi:hypothetical protein
MPTKCEMLGHRAGKVQFDAFTLSDEYSFCARCGMPLARAPESRLWETDTRSVGEMSNEQFVERQLSRRSVTNANGLHDQVGRHERDRRVALATKSLQDELRRVEKELAQLANLVPIERHFAAICAAFQKMDAHERAEALDQLLEQQDGPTLAALIDAPSIVTGLTAHERNAIQHRLYERVSPTLFELLTQLEDLVQSPEGDLVGPLDANLRSLELGGIEERVSDGSRAGNDA